MDNHDLLPTSEVESTSHVPPSPSPSISTLTTMTTPTVASGLLATPHKPKLPFQLPSMLLTPPPTTSPKKISRKLFELRLQSHTSAFPATPRKAKGKGVMIAMDEDDDDDEDDVQTIMESEMEIQAPAPKDVFQTPQKQKIHVDEWEVPDAPRKQRFRDFSARKGEEKGMGGGVKLDFTGHGIRKKGAGAGRGGRGDGRGKITGGFVKRMEEMYGEGVLERAVEDTGIMQKRGREGNMGVPIEREDGREEKRRKVDFHVDEWEEDTIMGDTEHTQDMQVVIVKTPVSRQDKNKVAEK